MMMGKRLSEKHDNGKLDLILVQPALDDIFREQWYPFLSHPEEDDT